MVMYCVCYLIHSLCVMNLYCFSERPDLDSFMFNEITGLLIHSMRVDSAKVMLLVYEVSDLYVQNIVFFT